MLVLEPDEHARLLATTLLERAGHRVVAAADGREAMRRFYEERPALVVTELDAPELDGWSVIARVRELSDVPVIVLTADTGELETVRAFRMGADDVVTKPFRSAELLARVTAVLRRGTTEAGAGPPRRRPRADRPPAPVGHRRPTARCGSRRSSSGCCSRWSAIRSRSSASDQLRQLVWADSEPGSGDEVRVYIGYLRRKFRELGEAPIETVRGFGYRYEPAPVALSA